MQDLLTNGQFNRLWENSLEKLDAYIKSQVTPGQKQSARHHKNSLLINEEHWRWRFTTALKGRYNHLEEYFWYQCSCCGTLTTNSYAAPHNTRMLATNQCFICDYWEEIAHENDPKRMVIDGHTYSDGGRAKPGTPFLGFGGAKFIIQPLGKPEERWTTNNLWSGSDIPAQWTSLMPNTHEFIKE